MKDKPAKKSYRVYFDQINQTYIDVDAENIAEAKNKAIGQYQRQFEVPFALVEENS